MRHLTLAVAAFVSLATPALSEDRPPRPAAQTDAACKWEWISGGGLGLWAETCPLKTGLWAVSYNERDKRFELKLDGKYLTTVVEAYVKPKDAPISAILAELHSRGHIPDATECVFRSVDGEPQDKSGRTLFEIRPIGGRLKTFEATPNDEIPEPPCGDYGWSTHGRRTFRVDPKHPDVVLYVDEGQDGTMTAPETITFE